MLAIFLTLVFLLPHALRLVVAGADVEPLTVPEVCAASDTPAEVPDWQCLLDVGALKAPVQLHPRSADTVVAGHISLHAAAAPVPGKHGADSYGMQVPTANKLVLVALETFPLVGWLGFDRIYLGQIRVGLLKMAICICTLFLGGSIWGLIDGYIVIANAMARETAINRLGMSAVFDQEHVQVARYLAIVTLLCWAALAICCVRAAGNRHWRRKETKNAVEQGLLA